MLSVLTISLHILGSPKLLQSCITNWLSEYVEVEERAVIWVVGPWFIQN